MTKMGETKEMWIYGGQFHCNEHKKGIPFYFVPMDGRCAECSDNAPESYLKRALEEER